MLKQEDLQRGRTTAGLDLASYLAIIDTIREQEGVGGQLTLSEGEQQRTEKRRMSIAAQQRGYKLTWRKAPEGQLRFVLAAPGEPAPGGRQRREATPAPATDGRRRRPQEATPGPGAVRRGRRG